MILSSNLGYNHAPRTIASSYIDNIYAYLSDTQIGTATANDVYPRDAVVARSAKYEGQAQAHVKNVLAYSYFGSSRPCEVNSHPASSHLESFYWVTRQDVAQEMAGN